MSALRIYGVARTRAFRPLWVAKELGIAYEHLPIEIGGDGARTPEFLAINPNGRLPVIADDGFVLFESLAITLYLAKKYSNGVLYPAKIEGRGEDVAMELLGDRRSRSWRQYLVAARCAAAPEERDPALRDEALKVIAAPFKVLDTALARNAVSAWQRFTRRRSQRRLRHQPRGRYGSVGVASSQGLADTLSRPADGACGARAEDQSRQRNARGGHPAHRTDQPPMSSEARSIQPRSIAQ